MAGGGKISITLKTEQKVYSFKKGDQNLTAANMPQVMLAADTYEAERIKNPMGGSEGSDWLAIEKDGLLHGKSEISWKIAVKNGDVVIEEVPVQE